jgi:hypothetical protein
MQDEDELRKLRRDVDALSDLVATLRPDAEYPQNETPKQPGMTEEERIKADAERWCYG